ncbi:hypothetical protein AURANDRAFT_38967 [Aureococcus anophagefferens]|uniref:CobW/HypB/UreG nucleotide-binding domain-containing protein n=1 Tax=Aureococcus anophagefferens TaxID=44056 RepID=F0YK26_AURAN|nr:hypothetical protein AURANDRAFT_38967 [Aureococcus anophagefferens]EGB04509.1 hypothetical protein AURANDRAFT_38967 [Aureococcus anophagefferens]|mmetsp:Transcript_5569/g.18951  ORF Transcript_5569/g.18951 Transcript_5569/m.18951 type:complete len:318 (-) Transcript_5569:562-1515(-)|eukprot:XP_009040762.1 hypothetical protein AURANDRAFT_38967 [Aureococcus anophagefferens]
MNVMDEALHDDDEPAPLLVPYAGGASPVVAGPGGRAKVPVTILCGFLGAGKSTLLRRLLAGDHGLRIAVVENEFADTRGLESVLVSEGACALSPDGAIVELRNGCVCCSVKDELATALEDLVARAARPLDAIVVELSGVADPGPVAAAFWLDEALESSVELDSILCVVDCVRGRELLASRGAGGFEARRQVAHADRIVLNKCDAAPALAVDVAAATVTGLNPAADARRAVRGRGDFPIRGWLVASGSFAAAARSTSAMAAAMPGAFAFAHNGVAWGAATATLDRVLAVDARTRERHFRPWGDLGTSLRLSISAIDGL